MKIITMRRLTLDKTPLDPNYDEDPNDWFCVIETPEEELVYDEYLEHPDQYEFLWNAMVKHAGLGTGLAWGNDDVYAYIRPDETEPEVSEKYADGDGDTWLRME